MFLILFGVALATGMYYVWKSWKDAINYWDERGIPSIRPVPLFGNSWALVTGKMGVVELHRSVYENFPDDPFYVFHAFMKPYLVVKDTEHIERILIKDFHHFVDRGFGQFDDINDPLSVNLFNMSGKKWRAMRNKFSPMFTTGKLRHMTPQMTEITETLLRTLNKDKRGVDLKDKFLRLSMDIIASCAFGLNLNTIEETEDSEFRKMGQKSTILTAGQYVRFFLHICFPSIAKRFKVRQNEPDVVSYFSKIIRETLAHRKASKQTRNDFVQMMVTLQEKGSIEFEGDHSDDYLLMDKSEKKFEHYELTDEVMVGQAFVFLLAGFEAGATALMFLCYELATNQRTQSKLREEVTKIVKARGSLDYDSLREMTYLDQCIKETMRMHTSVGILFRECNKDYTFPGTSLTIKAGESLMIPSVGIHYDPKYYEEPDKFNPERFNPDVTRHNCSYLPFGDGPRICIGMRFALFVIKLAVARILVDHTLVLSSKTKLPIKVNTASLGLLPQDPMYFDLV